MIELSEEQKKAVAEAQATFKNLKDNAEKFINDTITSTYFDFKATDVFALSDHQQRKGKMVSSSLTLLEQLKYKFMIVLDGIMEVQISTQQLEERHLILIYGQMDK